MLACCLTYNCDCTQDQSYAREERKKEKIEDNIQAPQRSDKSTIVLPQGMQVNRDNVWDCGDEGDEAGYHKSTEDTCLIPAPLVENWVADQQPSFSTNNDNNPISQQPEHSKQY